MLHPAPCFPILKKMSEHLIKGVDYTGVSVVFFCHDGKGKFLMAKRSVNTRDEHGRYDIGAGGVEFGHTIEETLRKEIKEEYCTDILDLNSSAMATYIANTRAARRIG